MLLRSFFIARVLAVFVIQPIQAREVTEDQKKGKSTDYVTRQYIGNLGKTEKGIVSLKAYGLVDGITYPLIFKIFKLKNCLKEADKYKTKPQLAVEIIQELQVWGFNIKLVLADSLSGKIGDVIQVLEQLKTEFIMTIRSSHGVLMLAKSRKRYHQSYCLSVSLSLVKLLFIILPTLPSTTPIFATQPEAVVNLKITYRNIKIAMITTLRRRLKIIA